MHAPAPSRSGTPSAPFRLLPWLLMALAAAPAYAQEDEGGLGLDLTTPQEDAPPQPNPTGTDFRPSLTIIGVSTPPDDAELAAPLGAALVQAAQRRNIFQAVTGPEQVRETLGSNLAEAITCKEADCLEKTAAAVDAERVLVGHLTRDGKRLKLELLAFARGQTTPPERAEVDARSRGELSKKSRATVTSLLQKVATPLAQLKVTTNLSGATVMLGERELGVGSMEKLVPPGKHTLRVTAPEYRPFETEVELPPGGTQEVEATLTEIPPTRPAVATPREPAPTVKKTAGAPLWTRPPVYVAAAGLAVLGVGIALGASAQGVASRARDANGDGLLDVTRAELQAARQQANLANILMGSGAALTAGGAVWFVLTPAPVAVSSGPGAPIGVGVVAAGTF